VGDLAAAKPHVPDRLVLDAHDYDIYCRGYYMALAMTLKVFDHAEARWKLYLRTKRLETRRRRQEERNG
jgi:hypothetical protein